MRRGIVIRVAAGVAVLLAALVIYVVIRYVMPLPLPDIAKIQERLAASVAAREPLESVLEQFWQGGFACSEAGDGSGAWHCDIAEGETEGRPETESLECPMRVMVSLLPDETGRLTGYAVVEGVFCM
jgi:hypothetical protein